MRVVCNPSDWLFSEEAYSIYAPCMYQPTYNAYIALMNEYVSDKSVIILVCESDEQKVGLLVLRQSDTVYDVLGIAVLQRFRHRRIGCFMLEQSIAMFNPERLIAQTDDDAIGFYRSYGFIAEKTVVEYPDGPSVRYNCTLYTHA